MVDVPLPVIVSMWVVLFLLCALVILSYRQLAYLLHLSSGGTPQSGGLDLGRAAPAFHLETISGAHHVLAFEDQPVPSLIMFADPRCAACDDAMAALRSVVSRLRPNLRVLIVTGEDPNIVSALGTFDNLPFMAGVVDESVVRGQYRVSATPFFIGVDSMGEVACQGSVTDASGIESLLDDLLQRNRPHPVGFGREGI
jgi:hypothetical protein